MNRNHLLIVLLAIALGMGIWQGPKSYNQYQALNLSKKGDDQLFTGQLVASQQLFIESIARDPSIYASWVGLATSYVEQRKFDLAIQSCNDGIKHHPGKVELHRVKAEALEKLERYPEAVQSYDEALKVDPDESLVKRLRDRALKKTKKA